MSDILSGTWHPWFAEPMKFADAGPDEIYEDLKAHFGERTATLQLQGAKSIRVGSDGRNMPLPTIPPYGSYSDEASPDTT